MIRSFIFQLYLVIGTLIIGLIGLPVLFFNADKKRQFCQNWCRAMLAGLKTICSIKAEIHGAHNLPAGGAVIAANHQSMWETMQLFAILHKPVMVLKKELLMIPLFGTWLRASGCIAIDRSAGAKAMRQLISDAKTKTAEGGQIIIFPEGTRAKPGETPALKPGIAGIYTAANVPCVPVGHDSGRFWHFPGYHKTSGTITMNIAPQIDSGKSKKDLMSKLETCLNQARPDVYQS